MTTDRAPNPEASQPKLETIASLWHTLLVLAIVVANAYRSVLQAKNMSALIGANRRTMYLRTMGFELAMLALVAFGVWLRDKKFEVLFGKKWSAKTFFQDIGIGLVLLIASLFLGGILGGHQGGGDSNQRIAFLLPQTKLEIAMWCMLSVTAGICEEAIYRGYLQRQFAALSRRLPVGIVASALVFGGVHLYQGWQRAAVIAASAVLFGIVSAWRKSVRPGMIAHAVQDGIAPLLIRLMAR